MPRPKVTWESVRTAIEGGLGVGFGENYKPALSIKRWNASPVSVQVLKALPNFNRQCHFFSHSEWLLALLFSWVGCHIREQFPLWPWPSNHPEFSRFPELDYQLTSSIGMLEICKDTGIKHGNFIGTNIPYIWSIDLCAFMPWIDDIKRSTCFISVKPLMTEQYLYVDPFNRGVEKLEGERRYAQQLGINYFVGDRSLFPGPIFSNLEMLAPAADLPKNHPWNNLLDSFLNKHHHLLQDEPLSSIRERLIKDFKCQAGVASYIKNYILWNQLIDCDLSKHIKDSLPAIKGGRKLIQSLRKTLSGEIR
ncbi:MAG TPA: hypothetical protein PLP44_05200 [Methylophilus sp.]|nr:hypothetical protein [Methylophilus sp.]